MRTALLPLPARKIDETRLVDFRIRMREILARHGLQFYMVGNFPQADRAGLLENLIASNWPDDLLRRYEATDMFRQSRIVEKLKRSIIPVSSESLLFARAREEGLRSSLAGVFYDDGFACTIGISLHDANRDQYLIMLSGPSVLSDDQPVATLILDVMKALDALTEGLHSSYPLSHRELDCLRWCAAGKSSEEIAVILKLSGHTVNDYLRTAMRKLDVTNRVQAVAKACRLRLI